jgi:hypothetical protein
MEVNLVTEIISTITTWMTGFWTFIKATIESAIGLFYNTTDGLTVIGVLALFGLAVGLVYFGISFVTRFFKI